MFRLLIKALKKIYRGIYKFKECYIQSKEFSVSPVKAFQYVLKGFSVNEYYCYQLNSSNYKDYLTFHQGHLPHRVNSFGDISGDKLSFSEIFKQFVDVPVNLGYIKKGCIYALNDSGINNENFYNYVINNEVYIKPYNGSDGRGIVHLASDADRKFVFRGGG